MKYKLGCVVLLSFYLFEFLVTVEAVRAANPATLRINSINPSRHHNRNKPRENVLGRSNREVVASYEEGVEYEYEDEEDDPPSTTIQPPVESKSIETVKPKPQAENEVTDGEEDEYYESYDDNEEHESQREREREMEAEEERQEEERLAERRREDERREEEDRIEEERREKLRKEEEDRLKEEERVEEEERRQEENRRNEEYRRIEERMKEEQRRQMAEYESSYEDVTTPSVTALPTEEVPEEIVTTSSPVDLTEEDLQSKSSESTEESENNITPEPTPIQESGMQELERYSNPDVLNETSYEEEEVEEDPETPEQTIEKEEENEIPTTEIMLEVDQNESLTTEAPGADDLPYSSSSPQSHLDSASEEEMSPDETEGLEEHEIYKDLTTAAPLSPSPKSDYPVKLEENGKELYSHQDLETQEEDEDETEFYEGRRFNENSRVDKIQETSYNVGNEERGAWDVQSRATVQTNIENEVSEEDEIESTTTMIRPHDNIPFRTTDSIISFETEESRKPQTGENEENKRIEYETVESHENSIIPKYDTNTKESVTVDYYPTRPETTIGPIHIEFIDSNRKNSIKEDTQATKIECFPGYELSPDGTECWDVNECNENVCGSTQICLNIPGSYRCTCDPGFIKDFKDQKMCRDLNECEFGNGGCSHDCVNTRGSFHCSCPEHSILAPNGRSCFSKPRSAFVSTTTTTTTTTSKPVIDKVTVEVEKEHIIPYLTTTNQELDNKVTYCPTPPVPRGSGIAYLYCSRIPIGIHQRDGHLEQRSSDNVRRNQVRNFRHRRNPKKQKFQSYSPGSVCELRCRSGFQLKGQYLLTCSALNGSWTGTTNGFCQDSSTQDNYGILTTHLSSNILPTKAPQFPIRNVEVVTTTYRPFLPPSTSFRPIFYPPPPAATFPTIRVTTPSHHFDLPTTDPQSSWPTYRRPTPPPASRHNYNFNPPTTYRPFTSPNKILTNPPVTNRNSFIQLSYRFKTPWIKCPDDIMIDLQPNQNLAYVILPQPQTNVDWWRQVTSDPSWAKGLETEIGPGKHRIMYRARTSAPVNNTADCSFMLEVRDNEPPRVRECPESRTVKLSPAQNAQAIFWNEPHFTDNVRISTVKKSHEPGTTLMVGEHLVNYEAKDPSGNSGKCSFTITVVPSQIQNNPPKIVNNGGLNVRPENHSSMKNVVCHVGRKGRRIIFQSMVVPRGCSEINKMNLLEDGQPSSINTINTLTQNSGENSVASQISSVSFSSNDHPQSASSFGHAVSTGRNANRLVHSSSSVTNGAHGTNSRSSSYAVAVSSSSRNFELPISSDRQVYDDELFVPVSTDLVPNDTKTRSAKWNSLDSTRGGGQGQQNKTLRQNIVTAGVDLPNKKYFKHFYSWGERDHTD